MNFIVEETLSFVTKTRMQPTTQLRRKVRVGMGEIEHSCIGAALVSVNWRPANGVGLGMKRQWRYWTAQDRSVPPSVLSLASGDGGGKRVCSFAGIGPECMLRGTFCRAM